MLRSFAFVLALALLAPAVHAATPPDVEITTCGQVIPKKALGYLTADLDCSGYTGGPADVGSHDHGAAVYMGKKSRLDLRGFTLTAGKHGVRCDVQSCGRHRCSQGPCEVFNGTIVASVPENSHGVSGQRPNVHDVTVRGFWFCIQAFRRLTLSNSTIDDCTGVGVIGKSLTITNTNVTDSGNAGVVSAYTSGAAPRLTDSSVTGSGGACTSVACADIVASREPRLVNSTCETSYKVGDLGSWGVCTLD